MRKNQKGFTLVELAIVIGLIAILVSGIVFGMRALSNDAKVDKVVEMVKKVQTASAVCRMKNGSAFTSGLDINQLSTMVSDSQCRTTTTDRQGALPSGIPTSGAGYTNLSASWDTTNGAIVLNITAEDGAIAQKISTELQRVYGTTDVSVSGNTVTVNLRL